MPPPLDQNSVLKSIDRFDDSIFVSVSGESDVAVIAVTVWPASSKARYEHDIDL